MGTRKINHTVRLKGEPSSICAHRLISRLARCCEAIPLIAGKAEEHRYRLEMMR